MYGKFTGNIYVTNDIIQFLVDNKRIELFMFETCCEFPYAVVTGLEPATLGVTGRYSIPTELHDYNKESFNFRPLTCSLTGIITV